ncbi:MAG: hypothetical protein ACK5TH_05875 [Prosthecobacter sp.]
MDTPPLKSASECLEVEVSPVTNTWLADAAIPPRSSPVNEV